MSQVTDIVALVFDFDETLIPDSTTMLLKAHGIDTEKFWGVQAKDLIRQGYELGAMLRTAVAKCCLTIQLQRQSAL